MYFDRHHGPSLGYVTATSRGTVLCFMARVGKVGPARDVATRFEKELPGFRSPRDSNFNEKKRQM